MSVKAASLLGKSASGRVSLLLVIGVVAVLASWRLAFVMAGLDPDTDAYGHHAIARQILETPRNLSVHWVWLPLFHYLQALAVALGATLQSVRLFNVIASAATPLVLYALLRSHRLHGRRDDPPGDWDPTPAMAGIITALSPIAMQMGTTGQIEPLFALTVVSLLYALAHERTTLAAVLLTLAVLMRYEAWSLPPAYAGFLVMQWLRRKPEPLARWAVVVAPLLAIFGWAATRHFMEGSPWFSFLKKTRTFANEALGAKSSFALGARQVLKDVQYYAVDVAWRCIGYPLLLAPFGLWRAFRREGLRFCGLYLALLAFITFSWLMRSSLGLDRHFVVLVPFYATLMASGAVAIGEFVGTRIKPLVVRSEHAFLAPGAARAAVIAGLGFAAYGTSWELLRRWMRDWTNASEQAWPDRRAVAAFVAELPKDALIFCDEPTIEVLSGLPRQRFDRRPVDSREARARYRTTPQAYIVTWAVRALPITRDGEATIAYVPPGVRKPDEGLVVLRVLSPARQAATTSP